MTSVSGESSPSKSPRRSSIKPKKLLKLSRLERIESNKSFKFVSIQEIESAQRVIEDEELPKRRRRASSKRIRKSETPKIRDLSHDLNELDFAILNSSNIESPSPTHEYNYDKYLRAKSILKDN